jgi:class 3 adenylate cyclase
VPERPTGTVTFLFTDIEGSTKLWEQYPAAMEVAVARHDAILRGVVEAHLGYVVKTTGDGLLAAFGTAHAALVAAVHAQRSLLAETSREIGSLRVRMGFTQAWPRSTRGTTSARR